MPSRRRTGSVERALLRALIDWADLATRHSHVALQALQKSQELIIRFVSAGTAAI
jgi:hypothetical protein